MYDYDLVVHGGAGNTSSSAEEGCRLAYDVGMKILQEGGGALKAAVEAVAWMETSARFNTGGGAFKRIDGTIVMDAAVATSQGVQGTVEGVSGIQNPVLLAHLVAQSTMRRIQGPGATTFALEQGLEPHPGPTEAVLTKFEDLKEGVRSDLAAGRIPAGWTENELRSLVGYDGAYPSGLFPFRDTVPHDTVGAIARDDNNVIALAASTGGRPLMPSMRVGDVPVRGSGFQIWDGGGVLATGEGEDIIDKEGADKVAQLIRLDFTPQRACAEALTFFPETIVGFVALTREAVGVAANCPMASYPPITE